MTSMVNIIMAQLSFIVGDIDGNTLKIIEAAEHARDVLNADIIVFPELALCGYPPEDLLLRPSLSVRTERALEQLRSVNEIDIVFGVAAMGSVGLENQAVVLRNGQVICRYAKRQLPNYQVFDEQRYFLPGSIPAVFDCKGVTVALIICEDLWYKAPVLDAEKAKANLVISLNASPFHTDKYTIRHQIVRERCCESGLPIIYTNLVGGQDELVFDGGSFAMEKNGEIAVAANYFSEELCLVQFDISSRKLIPGVRANNPQFYNSVYQALVLGVKDYVNKNGFQGVVLGLSGGLDSGLTLAIATDALGPERVQAVMMPYEYTSDISLEDAAEEAALLGVDYKVVSISPICKAFTQVLSDEFQGYEKNTTEENLQSRSRGMLLMAISNKKGFLVLTTSNKSEMSVGYATLYGDMAGGFNVLKDVPKTLVKKLATYRNTEGYVIPHRVINRPPSAELAPNQKDEDSLPPYDQLDAILELYIEQDKSAEDIVARGYEKEVVYKILRLVDMNEFKRRQAPVGIRITPRGFGRDRRYPISNGWDLGI